MKIEGQDSLMPLALRVLEQASRQKKAQVEVYASRQKTFLCEVREGRIETLRQAVEQGLALRVIHEGRLGFAWSTDMTDQGLQQAVEQAWDNAAYTAPDQNWELPEPAKVSPKPSDIDIDYAGLTTEQKIQYAHDLETKTKAHDPRIKALEIAAYQDIFAQEAVVNSKGLQAESHGTYYVGRVTARAEQGDEKQMGYIIKMSRLLRDLGLPEIAMAAASRAVGALGARVPATGEVPVVIDPWVLGQLLEAFVPAFSAQEAQKGKSVLADKTGSRVGGPLVELVDDGTLPGRPGSTACDSEGVATRRKALVSGGVLQGLLHNTYTAKKGGTTSTGNAVRPSFKGLPDVGATNFFLAPGKESREALLSRVSGGLYVEDAMGLHTVDPISGDFSLAVNGQWIEGGRLSYPVKGATIAGNLLDLLGGVEAVASDLTFWTAVGSPTVLFRKMMVAGG